MLQSIFILFEPGVRVVCNSVVYSQFRLKVRNKFANDSGLGKWNQQSEKHLSPKKGFSFISWPT